ncbi:DUF3365 domain-containing protein [bacterium]|nr:DUF3365 domain-containing protein [bacterium]
MFKNLTIRTKLICVIIALLIIAFVVNGFVVSNGVSKSIQDSFVAKSVAITQEAENGRNYVGDLRAKYSVFNDEDLLKSEDDITDRYFWTIPVVAGWTIGGTKSEESGYDFHTPAHDARNEKNNPDESEDVLLTHLTKVIDSGQDSAIAYMDSGVMYDAVLAGDHWVRGEKIQGAPTAPPDGKLRFARAVVLDESCMLCHGTTADDPDGDGYDPLGIKMEGWKPGQVHGMFEVVQDRSVLESAIAAQNQSIAMAAVGIILISALLVGIATTFTMSKPLAAMSRDVESLANDVAAGKADLTSRVQSANNDEIGQMAGYVNVLIESMQSVIGKFGTATSQVMSSSEAMSRASSDSQSSILEITRTIEQVARGSEDTNQNLGEAQESLNQNAMAIENISRDIEDVASFATQAAQQGSDGKKATDEAVQVISRANASVQQTGDVVKSLGEKTAQISQFIGTITGIADQTNLLALNAAIEAARAGEAGRGFAVVAEEVRKLAEESNTAAGNITSLVKSIEGEMNTALEAMDKSSEEVSAGASIVAQASQILDEIVKGVQDLTERVQNISAAAEEINASTGEVVNVMQNVAAVSEENSAASEEVASNAQSQQENIRGVADNAGNLSALAQELSAMVSGFKVG